MVGHRKIKHIDRLKSCDPCARYPYKIDYAIHLEQVEVEKKLAAHSDDMEIKARDGE